jgi:predicted RecA/RadA family phage recombinase
MKNSISTGSVVPHTPTAAVTSGLMVLLGTRVGVAVADIAANATGSLQVVGEFLVPKLSTDSGAQGAALYWDNTNKRLTTTAAGNTYAGWATRPFASGDASVYIKINN